MLYICKDGLFHPLGKIQGEGVLNTDPINSVDIHLGTLKSVLGKVGMEYRIGNEQMMAMEVPLSIETKGWYLFTNAEMQSTKGSSPSHGDQRLSMAKTGVFPLKVNWHYFYLLEYMVILIQQVKYLY
ncbi:MAG: hypothetical protein KAS32_09455 [Candidatus Peribacteraceae bacterium]|nr:hypothetical protein [Candidatus Peribacteraceae bacterium]